MKLTDEVQSFWENETCGTASEIVSGDSKFSLEWFKKVEDHRYKFEPFIHSVAQFPRHHGKRILEVGVGAGTDHLQWAKCGAACHGVDLTQAAIETTKAHLALYGFESKLNHINAEEIPYEDNYFDLVYSWGVIHHSENPQKILDEIRRILKPGGVFVGMMYKRYSIKTLRLWISHALLQGKPFQTFSKVIWNHMESKGTKAYTQSELADMFSQFHTFSAESILTDSDTSKLPTLIIKYLPQQWGWYYALNATK